MMLSKTTQASDLLNEEISLCQKKGGGYLGLRLFFTLDNK